MMRCNPYEHVLNVRNVGRLELEWSYATTDGSNSSPAVANGVVYFGLVEKVYALNASTGSLLWTFSTLTSSSPAVANGVVYIGGGNDNNGEVYALNAKTGAELWSYTTTGNLTWSPVVVNGIVYASSGNGSNVYAFGLKRGLE
jgi:eukaryotic-like serine/threonine-protein kinase